MLSFSFLKKERKKERKKNGKWNIILPELIDKRYSIEGIP